MTIDFTPKLSLGSPNMTTESLKRPLKPSKKLEKSFARTTVFFLQISNDPSSIKLSPISPDVSQGGQCCSFDFQKHPKTTGIVVKTIEILLRPPELPHPPSSSKNSKAYQRSKIVSLHSHAPSSRGKHIVCSGASHCCSRTYFVSPDAQWLI